MHAECSELQENVYFKGSTLPTYQSRMPKVSKFFVPCYFLEVKVSYFLLKHWLKSEKYISVKHLISLLYSPVLFVFGSSGNLLICIVMRRGSLKKISTCFYMAVLGLLDTGKFTPSEEGHVKK